MLKKSNPAKILIVDHTPANLDLLQNMLEKEGHEVRCAPNGEMALQLMRLERPDLVLLDIQLPDMDGTEVLKMIRAQEDLKDTLVIAVTSYAMAGDRERLLAAGCNGYIEKPIDPVLVISQIEKVIGV